MNILYAGTPYGEIKYINTLGEIVHSGRMAKTIEGKKDSVFFSNCDKALRTVGVNFEGVTGRNLERVNSERYCIECAENNMVIP